MLRGVIWLSMACMGHSALAESPPVVSTWEIRMRRVEGAAADIRRAAEDVEETLKLISDSNSLSKLSTLKTQLQRLEVLVTSGRLAVAVANEESQRN
jgi:hypothetical protein